MLPVRVLLWNLPILALMLAADWRWHAPVPVVLSILGANVIGYLEGERAHRRRKERT